MVRLGALATALALVLGGAAAADPGVYAGADQWADGSWIVGKGPRPDFYFAIGYRTLAEDGVVTVGAVGKGRCTVQKGKNWTMISCVASGRGKEIPMEDFRMDPLLESASLRVTLQGYRHTVSWSGRGRAPMASADVQASDGYASAGGGIFRLAKAAGRVFGHKLSSGGRDLFAFLMEGAGAGAYTYYGDVTFLQGGRVRYEVSFRSPR
jgi:hypothetical protein